MIGLDALEKLPAYERLPVQVGLAGGFALVFLSGCVFWALRRRPGAASRPAGAAPPARRADPGPADGANLGFLVGIARTMAQSDYYDFLYGMPTPIVVLLTVPLATAGMAVVLVYLASRCWVKRTGTLTGRLRSFGHGRRGRGIHPVPAILEPAGVLLLRPRVVAALPYS